MTLYLDKVSLHLTLRMTGGVVPSVAFLRRVESVCHFCRNRGFNSANDTNNGRREDWVPNTHALAGNTTTDAVRAIVTQDNLRMQFLAKLKTMKTSNAAGELDARDMNDLLMATSGNYRNVWLP